MNRYNNDLTCKFIESLVESYVGIVVVVLSATPPPLGNGNKSNNPISQLHKGVFLKPSCLYLILLFESKNTSRDFDIISSSSSSFGEIDWKLIVYDLNQFGNLMKEL